MCTSAYLQALPQVPEAAASPKPAVPDTFEVMTQAAEQAANQVSMSNITFRGTNPNLRNSNGLACLMHATYHVKPLTA